MYEKDWSDWEQEQTCYRTGFTQPKKKKRGLVATLLVLAIFLGGISTTFRLLNIELFQNVTENSAVALASVQFSRKTRGIEQAPGLPSLGVTGQEVSTFEQLCYHIPSGFYITQVKTGSAAEQAGLLPGDILLSFEGNPTPTSQSLKDILYTYHAGDCVSLLLYRQGQEVSVTLNLDEAS